MTTAVLFDLDDTLHSVRRYALVRLQAVAERVAADHPGIDAAALFGRLCCGYDEGGRPDLIDWALRPHDLAASDYIAVLVERYRNIDADDSLYPDVRPALRRLREQGIRLFLASDGPPDVQALKPRRLGIDACFEAILCTEAKGRHYRKPNPAAILDLLKERGQRPDETLAVGDNPYRDFVGLRPEGFRTCRICRPDGRFARVRLSPEYEADAEIASLDELPL